MTSEERPNNESPSKEPKDQNGRWERLRNNPWFLTTAVISGAAIGVGAIKLIEYLREHSTSSQEGIHSSILEQIIEKHFSQVKDSTFSDPKNSQPNLLREIARTVLNLHRDEKTGTDVRKLVGVIHPLRDVKEESHSLRQEVEISNASGIEGIDPNLVRDFLFHLGNVSQEVFDHVKYEYRHELLRSGYKVSVPSSQGRDWKEIGKIYTTNWRFPTLGRLRHTLKGQIRNSDEFGPESVMFPDNWLIVKKREEAVGYASFLTVASIPEDLTSFSFNDAVARQTEISNSDTIMITSITKAKHTTIDAAASAFFGLEDFARRYGIKRIIAPALSPDVRNNQETQGGEYSEWWLRVDGQGIPLDPWHRTLSLFFETREVNEQFMKFEIKEEELESLLDENQKTENKNNRIFSKASPVPIQKSDEKNYHVIVPAGWMSISLGSNSPRVPKNLTLFR